MYILVMKGKYETLGVKNIYLQILAKEKRIILNTFYCYLGYLFTSNL